MREFERCPARERLAAFVRKELTERESAMIASHALDCENCRHLVGPEPVLTRVRKTPASLLGIAIIASLLAGVTRHGTGVRTDRRLAQLVDVASRVDLVEPEDAKSRGP